jgi:hypothetical protein
MKLFPLRRADRVSGQAALKLDQLQDLVHELPRVTM